MWQCFLTSHCFTTHHSHTHTHTHTHTKKNTPPGGNIHSFTALSPCAVLDVLTPPYAPNCGRDCTYYREVFPPQLLDDAGHPLLMPSNDAAAWVRWQAAAPPGAGQLMAQQQRRPSWVAGDRAGGDLTTSGDDENAATTATSAGRDAEMAGGGTPAAAAPGGGTRGGTLSAPLPATRQPPPSAHPWATFGGMEQGLVVGLEPASMPVHFVVERGVYMGKPVHS